MNTAKKNKKKKKKKKKGGSIEPKSSPELNILCSYVALVAECDQGIKFELNSSIVLYKHFTCITQPSGAEVTSYT